MTIAERITQLKKDFDEVKQAEYDRFWNALQSKGSRNNYAYAFYMWADTEFQPKYPFTKDKTYSYDYAFYQSTITDLSGHSFKANGFNNTWRGCTQLLKIGSVYNGGSTFDNTFNGCGRLETIELIGCLANCSFGNTFKGCYGLKNITFDGYIGRSIDFRDCPLSADSVASIFDHLTTVTNQTLVFDKTITITEQQINSAKAKGWQILLGTEKV